MDDLKRLKKDELIHLVENLNKELSEQTTQIKNLKEEHGKEIQRLKQEFSDDKYDAWKKQINTKYLEEYLEDWFTKHISIEADDGYCCDSRCIDITLKFDNNRISTTNDIYLK